MVAVNQEIVVEDCGGKLGAVSRNAVEHIHGILTCYKSGRLFKDTHSNNHVTPRNNKRVYT